MRKSSRSGIAVLMCCLASVIVVAESTAIGADVQGESIQAVIKQFCETAKRVDRGVAITPFAGTIDDILISDDGLNTVRTLLKLTDDQVRQLRESHEDVRGGTSSAKPNDMVAQWDIVGERSRKILDSVLSEVQRGRRQIVYLVAEGLMAVRRPDFATRLNLTATQSQKIRKLINASMERCAPYHQAAFSDTGAPDNRRFYAELRQISQELDTAIAQELSDSQHQVLATLIKESQSMAFPQAPSGAPVDAEKMK